MMFYVATCTIRCILNVVGK